MSDPVIEFFDDDSPKKESAKKEVKEIKKEIVKKPEVKKLESEPVTPVKSEKAISREGDDLVFNLPNNLWFYASVILVFLIGASLFTHGFTDITGYFAGVPESGVPVVNESSEPGIVDLIFIYDSACADCYDPVEIHSTVLQQMGVSMNDTVRIFDVNSAEGQEYIEKYGITTVPTILISPVFKDDYPDALNEFYIYFGSVADDGWYVFEKNDAVGLAYKDLVTGEVLNKPLPGNFMTTGDSVCTEDGKPVIYFFAGTYCSYCEWERPIFINVTSQFGNWTGYDGGTDTSNAIFESDYIVVHAVETDVDTDSPHLSVFSEYGGSGVPFLVFGCEYYRPGAGTSFGAEAEYEYLTAGICALTGGEPAEVCDAVSDVSAEFK